VLLNQTIETIAKWLLTPIAMLCLVLALASCGEGDSPDKAGSTSTQSQAEPAKLTKPKVEVPSGPPPKKLVVDDLEVGSGPAAKAGDGVTVQYVGVEYKGGKQIDASWDRGEPFSFQLGSGAVIPGWEEGVAGMKAGGRRELVIPSKLAYGSGALVFVIDLIGIGDNSSYTNPARVGNDRPKPKVEVPSGPPPKELVIKDLDKGAGAMIESGREFVVDYVGVNYKTGQEFESTWAKSEPSKFSFGTGEVVEGWEEGLRGMRVGGRRELIVPSKLAYGTGALIYVIDLLKVE